MDAEVLKLLMNKLDLLIGKRVDFPIYQTFHHVYLRKEVFIV